MAQATDQMDKLRHLAELLQHWEAGLELVKLIPEQADVVEGEGLLGALERQEVKAETAELPMVTTAEAVAAWGEMVTMD